LAYLQKPPEKPRQDAGGGDVSLLTYAFYWTGVFGKELNLNPA
jgi:hypothetical protein